ncbi:response regulator [Cytobacillus sp. FSL W7-1323]|uniref:response regulator n=1 Tax=Cytobacillus sp. FSL W7-1323 TaxID=2921700 RepID=UPI00315903D7
MEKYHVFIIEDDFRVADINKSYIEQNHQFSVKEVARSAADALFYLEKNAHEIDVIFLDIYIPDVEGMSLLWKIRSLYPSIDIIIISAEKQAHSVRIALRAGVFDYVVKPVSIDRLLQSLNRYERFRQLWTDEQLDQEQVDELTNVFHIHPSHVEEEQLLPKGIDAITLEKILHLFEGLVEEGLTAVELSEQTGISRSTSRRYLEYLVSMNRVETRLIYGSVGRPQRKYVICS